MNQASTQRKYVHIYKYRDSLYISFRITKGGPFYRKDTVPSNLRAHFASAFIGFDTFRNHDFRVRDKTIAGMIEKYGLVYDEGFLENILPEALEDVKERCFSGYIEL